MNARVYSWEHSSDDGIGTPRRDLRNVYAMSSNTRVISSGLPPTALIPCCEAFIANGDKCRESNASRLAVNANVLHAA